MQLFPPGLFYLYYYENKLNGKMYIGKGSKSRWIKHIKVAETNGAKSYKQEYKHLHRSIHKYGIEGFEYGIFKYCLDEQDAYEEEKYWIAQLKEFGVVLYNLADGGDGGSTGTKRSQETKDKMSKALKGRISPMIGKKHTEEAKAKMSESAMGNTNGLGKIKSEDVKRNMSKSMRGIEHPATRKFSIEVEKEICSKYISGLSTDKLAKEYGVYKSTIRGILIRGNISLRAGFGGGRKCKLSSEQQKEVCELYAKGYTRAELKTRFNCGKTTIRDILIRNNIDLKIGNKNG